MKKPVRGKGKIRLGRYFQNLKAGDRVCIVREAAMPVNFPGRLQGRTGIIEEKRGKAYIVRLNDFNQEKKFIIEPVHLKKIKT